MSVVSVTNVKVGRNPCPITTPFELEISFECFEELEHDLEWKLVYVGHPEDKLKDQELDCVALGPVQRGSLRFAFVADAPDYRLIDKEDINGITIILLTGSYRNQEFVRVGWYLHNYFLDPKYIECPPDVDDMSLEEMMAQMERLILADAPRVTRFQINWDRQPAFDEPSFDRLLARSADEPFIEASANQFIEGSGAEIKGLSSFPLQERMIGELKPSMNDENNSEGLQQIKDRYRFMEDTEMA